MLPLAPGANGQPPRPPTDASSRVTPAVTAAYALASPAPRVLWKCAPSGTPPISGRMRAIRSPTRLGVVVPMVSAIASRSAPVSHAASTTVDHALGRRRPVERAVPRRGDDDLDHGAAVVGDRDDLGDLRGRLGGGAARRWSGCARRPPTPRTRSSAGPPRSPAWRRWGSRPARRTRCRQTGAARRPVRPRPPTRAPSTVRRRPSPPFPGPRSRRPRPAVRAWRTMELGPRSAARRAVRRRECQCVQVSRS